MPPETTPQEEPQSDRLEGATAPELVVDPSPALQILAATFDPGLERALEQGRQASMITLLEKCIAEAKLPEQTFREKTLIHEGEELKYCYFIRSGADIDIKKIINHPEGPVKLRIAVRKPPVIVGEIALLTDGIASAIVDLKGPVQLVRIPHALIRRMLDQHPELHESLSNLGVKRLEEQVHLVSRAQDAILSGRDGEAHQQLVHAFDYEKAFDAWQSAGGRGRCEIAKVTLHGINRSRAEAISENFTIDAEFENEQKTFPVIQKKPRRFLHAIPFLPRALREKEMTSYATTVRPALHFTITSSQGATVGFTLYDEGRHIETNGSYLEEAGIAGYGFLTQIYHAAFRQADRIETCFAEEQTLAYLREKEGEETALAPSALAAHSPVVAARKGFVTTIEALSLKNATASSDRVDREVEDILDVLINLERSLIDPKGWYGVAYRDVSQMYEKHSAKALFHWANNALTAYLAQPRETPLPERVQHLLELQQKRNEYLLKKICPNTHS